MKPNRNRPMKTLPIGNLRSIMLAAALLGTASRVFGVTVVFTEDFNDGDISDWTAGAENLDNPDDNVFPPVVVGGAVQLQAHASCFSEPFSGLGATLSKTITLPNGSYTISYDVSQSTTFYDYCLTGATGDSEIVVNGVLMSPVSCTHAGS